MSIQCPYEVVNGAGPARCRIPAFVLPPEADRPTAKVNQFLEFCRALG